jgi:hypothetical protein
MFGSATLPGKTVGAIREISHATPASQSIRADCDRIHPAGETSFSPGNQSIALRKPGPALSRPRKTEPVCQLWN